ncbi:MAG: hypothetical protein JWR33_813 [Naasia sp.]|jgi:glycosyltransferase involved in cell wall biosynthesis|uniref:glycosyltransferase n=1 Tax=Naasia sp. TaxID=2546198 RepID=UPI00261782ED|nr:glycosyltransferase [Naasia sp.]MCU1570072.1 hypothetical protein [Naasia sp.]
MPTDLVVLSHLRWVFVWQRPQHLVSRFAAEDEVGRIWFVEEPITEDVDSPVMRSEERDGVTRVWLAIPALEDRPGLFGFAAAGAERYPELLAEFLAEQGSTPAPIVLLYTPMAYDMACALHPRLTCYDVMDDLASFKFAPAGLRLRQGELLRSADVVFAGGRTLHRSISGQREGESHLFPSGVDPRHYAPSRALRSERTEGQRVAGYVGVVDERLDLELLSGLAHELPDWTIRVVGPVLKIEVADLPTEPNIEYPGMALYEDLPGVMAGFDVALMPFALNEATRSISPTKTLEYLAAGLPVVSTRVADVVSDYSGVVHFADDAHGFAGACRIVVEDAVEDRDGRARLEERHSWDAIADKMWRIVEDALADRSAARPLTPPRLLRARASESEHLAS